MTTTSKATQDTDALRDKIDALNAPNEIATANVRQGLQMGQLRAAVDPTGALRPADVRGYINQVLAEAGDPRDPLERMMVIQATAAHHQVLHLYGKAAAMKDAQLSELYHRSAARLAGELRRTILAIREYRMPTTDRKTTVVHQVQHIAQQNLVHQGEQDVQYVDAGERGSQLKSRDTELDSSKEVSDAIGRREQTEESKTGRGRATQPA